MSAWFSKKNPEPSREIQVQEDWNWNPSEGFVVLDIETTGLSPVKDRIIELALIQTDISGTPVAFWSTLVNPDGPVGATEIHGITDSDVENSPKFDSVADELLARIKGQAISAHNARFDMGFLKNELARIGWQLPEIPTVCTLEASKYFMPEMDQRRLTDCAIALGIPVVNAHRALGDVSMTAGILNYYLRREQAEGSPLRLGSFATAAKLVQWPTEKTEPIIFSKESRKRPSELALLDDDLLKALTGISALDIVDTETDSHEFEYAELLLEVLEDGQLSDDESASLQDVATTFELSQSQQSSIHMRLLSMLAAEAWKDGVVTQKEKRHIKTFAINLGFNEAAAKQVLDEIEDSRNEKLSTLIKVLPENWALGEPLRIGDRIVFTGCDAFDRFGLEKKAIKRGLKVTGSVSGKTALLVSDGTMQGNKAKAAEDLGVRVLHPTEFVELLSYIQAALPNSETIQREPVMETLLCQTCKKEFERVSVKGRKPVECPTCRG